MLVKMSLDWFIVNFKSRRLWPFLELLVSRKKKTQIQAVKQRKTLNVLFWSLIIKHLMTGPEGNSEFCFPSISILLFSKTKQEQILKNALRFLRHQATFNWSRATAVKFSRVTLTCFPFWRHSFRNVDRSRRETISLLDVRWPWTSQ